MPSISGRLVRMQEMLPKSVSICDVGADHGWLLIYAMLNNKIERAIATDVVKGPLNNAKKNINLYGLSDRIETRLGDGLIPVKPFEVSGCNIAGMGGITIEGILKRSPEVVSSFDFLLIQPMGQSGAVRNHLINHGFYIADECIYIENDIYYPYILFKKGIQEPLSEMEIEYGPINIKRATKEFIGFLNYDIESNNRVIRNLGNSTNPVCIEKIKDIEEKIEKINLLKKDCLERSI